MKTAGRVFLVFFVTACLTGCRHRLAEQPLTPRQQEWADQLDAWNWKWRLPYRAPYRSNRQTSHSATSTRPRQVLTSPELLPAASVDQTISDSIELPPATDLPPVMTDDEVVLVPMDSVPVEDAAPAPQTHTVAPGDSLTKLAVRYYGKSSLWKRIYEANRAVIDSPDKLKAGAVLTIPPAK